VSPLSYRYSSRRKGLENTPSSASQMYCPSSNSNEAIHLVAFFYYVYIILYISCTWVWQQVTLLQESGFYRYHSPQSSISLSRCMHSCSLSKLKSLRELSKQDFQRNHLEDHVYMFLSHHTDTIIVFFLKSSLFSFFCPLRS
jgi:hypothetical protein